MSLIKNHRRVIIKSRLLLLSAAWIDKLITKEDPSHLHKTLGVLSIQLTGIICPTCLGDNVTGIWFKSLRFFGTSRSQLCPLLLQCHAIARDNCRLLFFFFFFFFFFFASLHDHSVSERDHRALLDLVRRKNLAGQLLGSRGYLWFLGLVLGVSLTAYSMHFRWQRCFAWDRYLAP